MKPDPAEILKAALELPPEARAAIAGSLISSLDEPLDDRAEAEWASEIARRLGEIDAVKHETDEGCKSFEFVRPWGTRLDWRSLHESARVRLHFDFDHLPDFRQYGHGISGGRTCRMQQSSVGDR